MKYIGYDDGNQSNDDRHKRLETVNPPHLFLLNF